MKKLLLTALFLATGSAWLSAQAPAAKRYVLIEHFTNSRCSVCASKNPAFYNLIDDYPTDVHHIAIHPSVPYSNCVFYQANKDDNGARQDYYDIAFTPLVALNGTLLPSSSQLLPAAKLNEQLNQTSPVAVVVSETNETATVIIRSFGTPPTGNYRLFAALVEKEVNQTTPNGEAKHHDVLRDILTSKDGDPITLPAAGVNIAFSFSKLNPNSNWNPEQLYVLAWVQEVQEKTVLNSGTKFDPIILDAPAPEIKTVAFSPNPASGQTQAVIPGESVQEVAVYSIDGRLQQVSANISGEAVVIMTGNLTKGQYQVKITGKNASYIGRILVL